MPLPPRRLLLHENPDWFDLSCAGLPGLSWKRPLNGCLSCNSILYCYFLLQSGQRQSRCRFGLDNLHCSAHDSCSEVGDDADLDKCGHCIVNSACFYLELLTCSEIFVKQKRYMSSIDHDCFFVGSASFAP